MLKQKNINLSHKFGFTLVELLITVTILGILSTVAYVGVGEIRKTIRDNKRRADLNEVARALELFKADYGQYPVNNYYTTNYYDDGREDVLMPFLTDGSASMTFVYPGGSQDKVVAGGYLKEKLTDPINTYGVSFENSYMYMYYGSNWGNWPQEVYDVAMQEGFLRFLFPLHCPSPSFASCGDSCAGAVDDEALAICVNANWDECCNDTGSCYAEYCDYSGGNVSFTSYSLNGLSNLCYGPGTTRSLSLLMANLEKESKLEERINNVFAFCPTADPSHPNHADFVKLKKIFPRAKDCYDGSGATATGYNCSDPGDVEGDHWNQWALYEYNYFVPLTGEFNLR